MVRRVQHIRRSQVITTFGPGAIIETVGGPRIVLTPDKGLFYRSDYCPEDFEITHQRMTEGYLGGARVFRIPSNDELNREPEEYIYRTAPFPKWSLCTDHWKLYRQDVGCPECRRKGTYTEERGRREAIRFVLACSNGHLDDVPWDYAVHEGKPCSNHVYFEWRRRGPSLKDIKIRCPVCKKAVNLGEIYRKAWICPGRHPERGWDYPPEDCKKKAFVIQRQASNLYVPEIMTLFTIPPKASNLHNILYRRKDVLLTMRVYHPEKLESREAFEKLLHELRNVGVFTSAEISEILSYDWSEIEETLHYVFTEDKQKTPYGLFKEEFDAFLRASVSGYPPYPRDSPKVKFYINKNKVRVVTDPFGVKFRVAPVEKLHTVMVLTGYRRFIGKKKEESIDAKLVDISFIKDGKRWYPGTELFGEGIFITLENPEDLWIDKETYREWLNEYTGQDDLELPPQIFIDSEGVKFELHPVFVWWHTFSHLLIRAVSIDSGYSAASIRERVYVDVSDPSKARGGMILYTAQPNSEGTLGGLISLVNRFEHILERAYALAGSCSNDPLCWETKFTSGAKKVMGAACYACLFLSETSCEYRNMWLDRHILLEWLEGRE